VDTESISNLTSGTPDEMFENTDSVSHAGSQPAGSKLVSDPTVAVTVEPAVNFNFTRNDARPNPTVRRDYELVAEHGDAALDFALN